MESKVDTTMKEETGPVIQFEGKTSAEIIEQESAAVVRLCKHPQIDLLMEKEPLHVYKINLNYSMNKDLDIRLIYPPEEDAELSYPKSCLVLKLRSNNMPHNLVETLMKKGDNMIKKLALAGKPQVLPIFEFVNTIMLNNNLIPAWLEIPDIKEVLRTGEGVEHKDEIKLYEKAGKMKIILRNGAKFFLEFELTVPESYPYDKPTLKIIGSS